MAILLDLIRMAANIKVSLFEKKYNFKDYKRCKWDANCALTPDSMSDICLKDLSCNKTSVCKRINFLFSCFWSICSPMKNMKSLILSSNAFIYIMLCNTKSQFLLFSFILKSQSVAITVIIYYVSINIQNLFVLYQYWI